MRFALSLAAALWSLTAAAGCRPRTDEMFCGGSFDTTRALIEAASETAVSDAGCRGRAEVIGAVSEHDRTKLEVLGCGRLVELSCLCDRFVSGSCESATCAIDAEYTCFTPDSEVAPFPSSAFELDSDRIQRTHETGASLFAEGLYLESARTFGSGLRLLPEDRVDAAEREAIALTATSAYSEHLRQLEDPAQWLETYREAQGFARTYAFDYEKAYGKPLPRDVSVRFDELSEALTREFILAECAPS